MLVQKLSVNFQMRPSSLANDKFPSSLNFADLSQPYRKTGDYDVDLNILEILDTNAYALQEYIHTCHYISKFSIKRQKC